MKTKIFLSMAALALVGAMTVSCSSDDNIIEQPQQPENKSNVVTLTTTVGIGGGAGTRALAADGTKTFAAGETMAIVYKNTSGNTAVAVSETLQDNGDITNEGKSATFTFTLDSPDKDQNVTYVYPAAMVNNDGTVKNDALASQDGTLSSLASNLDYCTNSGAWDGDNLPTLTLDNQFAILALTLKNGAGSREITSSITGLTVSDGTNSYTVSRSAADGPIYVAIRPTTAALELTATDGSKNYTKTATSREYAAGSGYSLPLRMLTVISWSQSELEGISSMYDNGSRTLKGVTLTKSGGTFYTYDVGKYFGGVFQFSSIFGNLTKIEITTTYGSPIGDGWSGNVWTGNASTVNIAESAFNATNIVFTIAEDDVAVSSISLNKPSTSIEEGNTETLTATISPAEATDKSVTWTSSNPDVATVDAGVVTAVAAGEAIITAEASNGLTATCTVTVTAPAAPSLLSLTIGGATIYYAAGETWGQAISRHSSENARWSYEDGFMVYYDNDFLVNMDSDETVYEDETINPSTTYALF